LARQHTPEMRTARFAAKSKIKRLFSGIYI
jgi:hypothetical protein